ncbi:GAF and ANTAR domain-containing protein [Aeromicrobium chenweiae]|uniref:Uncharacterized protein n=1 Tax=Aeromicrobium chenweiae TaxID=2079793 RepID=A0A2S0WQ62_9ACTN|nr:GAF and ANTAR domain-containing protein [Aeromicrobium chenweiae]AWB93467.1 hypothetical protein C3E78_15305 [Aeromicrobium chenweiae]TGN34460.1 ANTAR domain-containing protein [Aeromicrobium chenweiae]
MRTQQPEASAFVQSVADVVDFVAGTFDTAHVGITLRRGDGFETVGPTTEVVRGADSLQRLLREGPWAKAELSPGFILSNDIARDVRWPEWGPRAAAMGLERVVSSELDAGGAILGSLNVYRAGGRPFTPDDVETGQLLASHAAIALRYTQHIERLTSALESRATIGQAQGVLMGRHSMVAEQALSMLQRRSHVLGVPLVEAARALLQEHGVGAGDSRLNPGT